MNNFEIYTTDYISGVMSLRKPQTKSLEILDNILNNVTPAKNLDLKIERAHKNISEIANYMLGEDYFPYVLFLEGSNFLTQNVTITRPDGRTITLIYNSGTLNRLDRLTSANYGMPINTNLCKNKYVKNNA